MVRAVRYAGKVYQNEMARAVQQLGYGIRLVRQNGEITGFEIEGVSDSLCERFSKRREEIGRQIEKFEDKQGRKPTVKEIALIARETRTADLKEIATSEVLAFQRSQLSRGMETIAGPSFASGSANYADSSWSGAQGASRQRLASL
jgi:conjugative relaxase-like TrwC/TraI family protein